MLYVGNEPFEDLRSERRTDTYEETEQQDKLPLREVPFRPNEKGGQW